MKTFFTRLSMIAILFCCGMGSTFAQTFCLQMTEMSNDGTNLVIKVEMQGDVAFDLADANLQFTYDNVSLGQPALFSSALPTPPFYAIPTVTTPLPGSGSLNIVLPSLTFGTTVPATPAWMEIAQITFPIVDGTNIGPFVWTYDGGTTGTVMFMDVEVDTDFPMQIFATDGACLLGIGSAIALPDCPTLVGPADLATGLVLDPADASALFTWTNSTTSVLTANNFLIGTDGVTFQDLGDIGAATEAINIQGLSFETTFFWTVVPTNADGSGVDCPVFSFTTEDTPPPPTGPTADCGEFTSNPNAIIDAANTQVIDVISVVGTGEVLADLNIAVSIGHSYVSDLALTLTSPDGTVFNLIGSCFGGAGAGMNVLFDDDGEPFVCSPNYLDGLIPTSPLAPLIGQDFDGDWTLTVDDTFPSSDDGTLITWCLLPTLIDPPTEGCTDPLACNYNDDPTITENNTLCIFATGCDTCSGLTNGNGVVVDNPEIGDACDDGDTFTENDVIGDDCVCAGTPIPLPTDDCGLYTSMPGLTVTTGTPAEDTIAVTGTAPQILTDLDVAVNIPHTFLADVEITITSPAGTSALILADQCGGSDDIIVLFDDDAAPIACASPTLGSYAPLNPLSVFNGESFDGDWIITVVDDAAGDDGSLVTWCLIPTLEDPPTEGCTDALACNYNDDPTITENNTLCIYPTGCDTCSGLTNGNGVVVDNPEIGDACDDGDTFTENDVLTACDVCEGTPIPLPTDDCGLYTSMPGLTVTTGTPAEDTIAVTGTAPQILTDLDVAVNIPHTFLADVEITITSPAGTSVLILADQCGGSDDIIVLFDDDAAPIACASPTLGSYAPLNPLSVFNGESFDGDWIITVVDDAAGDDGSFSNLVFNSYS